MRVRSTQCCLAVWSRWVESSARLGGFRALKKAPEAPYTTKVNNRETTSRGAWNYTLEGRKRAIPLRDPRRRGTARECGQWTRLSRPRLPVGSLISSGKGYVEARDARAPQLSISERARPSLVSLVSVSSVCVRAPPWLRFVLRCVRQNKRQRDLTRPTPHYPLPTTQGNNVNDARKARRSWGIIARRSPGTG